KLIIFVAVMWIGSCRTAHQPVKCGVAEKAEREISLMSDSARKVLYKEWWRQDSLDLLKNQRAMILFTLQYEMPRRYLRTDTAQWIQRDVLKALEGRLISLSYGVVQDTTLNVMYRLIDSLQRKATITDTVQMVLDKMRKGWLRK